MSDDGTHVVDELAQSADHDAAREVYFRLSGLLWHRWRAGDDPAAKVALAIERAELRARFRALVPGSPEVRAALAEWGRRVRQLDRP
jgi:hypothetical protein